MLFEWSKFHTSFCDSRRTIISINKCVWFSCCKTQQKIEKSFERYEHQEDAMS